MASIKSSDKLANDIWVHVAENPEDTAVLAEAEEKILAGEMSLDEALAHEFSHILTE